VSTEVDDDDILEASAPEKQIRRLDVAMDDPSGVRRAEGLGDATHHTKRSVDPDGAARQSIGEVLAFEPLHREIRAARHVAVRDVFHDARVLELGERRGLTTESVRRRLRGLHDLQRDGPPRRRVERTIHDAHTAFASGPFQNEAIGDAIPRAHEWDSITS
jgi:hypothetical protein